MKLEPIAKPIRIRIKIGHNEYSNLADVRNNFSVEELFPLFLDGRLERWLFQIGEQDLAEKVKALAEECDDSVSSVNYIKFLSVFFDDIDYDDIVVDGEVCFDKVPIETLKCIYRTMKGIDSICWKDLFAPCVTNQTIIEFFADEALRSLFSIDTEWGLKFVDKVDDDISYRKYFDYLADYIHAHPEGRKILDDYYYGCKNNGYEWPKMYASEGLEGLLKWYSVRIPQINWGELLAARIVNFEKESPIVEQVLKTNDLASFYKSCVNRGMNEAWEKLDPWEVLANDSIEYDVVMQALNEWACTKKFAKNLSSSGVSSDLGLQILKFLRLLVDLNFDYDLRCNKDDFCYLEDELAIMVRVRRRKLDYYHCFVLSDSDISFLEDLAKSKGNGLANYVLNRPSVLYSSAAMKCVSLIKRKIEKRIR